MRLDIVVCVCCRQGMVIRNGIVLSFLTILFGFHPKYMI